MPHAPRVLLVMPEQWPRALLRAALREAGYDALGAPGLAGALRYPPDVPHRGPLRLVLIDQDAFTGNDAAAQLDRLARRHGHPALVLLGRTGRALPLPESTGDATWSRVVRRPASIAELVDAVRAVLPLPPESDRPLD
jgi:hypothetical protein